MQKTNSATLRLKDSLSYRLGQAMIAYDKDGGGGFVIKILKAQLPQSKILTQQLP